MLNTSKSSYRIIPDTLVYNPSVHSIIPKVYLILSLHIRASSWCHRGRGCAAAPAPPAPPSCRCTTLGREGDEGEEAAALGAVMAVVWASLRTEQEATRGTAGHTTRNKKLLYRYI